LQHLDAYKQECKPESEEVLEAKNETKTVKKNLYFVYGGNYPETVWDALNRRGNWQLVIIFIVKIIRPKKKMP